MDRENVTNTREKPAIAENATTYATDLHLADDLRPSRKKVIPMPHPKNATNLQLPATYLHNGCMTKITAYDCPDEIFAKMKKRAQRKNTATSKSPEVKKKRTIALKAIEAGHSQSEAARISGLSVATVHRLCHCADEFVEALRKSKAGMANIALAKTVQIAIDDLHPKQLDACGMLLKHERSGGYGSTLIEHSGTVNFTPELLAIRADSK